MTQSGTPRPQVARKDRCFDRGEHALTAKQPMLWIRDRFDVDIPLRTLFEQPVFSVLAETVLSRQLDRFSASDLSAAWDDLQATPTGADAHAARSERVVDSI